jgi:hypothetical protein
MFISLYCSGGIIKDPNEQKICWSQTEEQLLLETMMPYTPLFLDPNADVPHLSDSVAQFGRDMYQIKTADFVVVDARERRGIGIGVEMIAAKYFRTPLVVILPSNSHYKKDKLTYRGATVEDYIHPHIFALADKIVDDFSVVGKTLVSMYEDRYENSSMVRVDEAVQAYINRVMPEDSHMIGINMLIEEQRAVKHDLPHKRAGVIKRFIDKAGKRAGHELNTVNPQYQ